MEDRFIDAQRLYQFDPGDIKAEARYLRNQMQTGKLSYKNILLAKYLGHQASSLLIDEDWEPCLPIYNYFVSARVDADPRYAAEIPLFCVLYCGLVNEKNKRWTKRGRIGGVDKSWERRLLIQIQIDVAEEIFPIWLHLPEDLDLGPRSIKSGQDILELGREWLRGADIRDSLLTWFPDPLEGYRNDAPGMHHLSITLLAAIRATHLGCNSAHGVRHSNRYLPTRWAENRLIEYLLGYRQITLRQNPEYYRNPETCSICGGLGYKIVERSGGGIDCYDCGGSGKYEKACIDCAFKDPGKCNWCKGVGHFPRHIILDRPCDSCTPHGPPGSMAAVKVPGVCSSCHGSKKQKNFRGGTRDCMVCRGKGTCYYCRGTNRLPEMDVPRRECYQCRQTGKCRKCRGRGVRLCDSDDGHEETHQCDWCGICPACKGRGVNSQDCYKCKGSGEQETMDEIRASLQAKYEHSKIRIRRHLQRFDIAEPRVELVAKRINVRPSMTERLTGKKPHLPDFYGDIIFAENYPLVDALFDHSGLRGKHLEELGLSPRFYSLWTNVHYEDALIGQIDDDHRYLAHNVNIELLLKWWAATDKGADEDFLEVNIAGAVAAIRNQTIHGNDTLRDWSDMLDRHNFSRFSDGYLSYLNLIRETAYHNYLNRSVKPFNFGH